MNMPNRPQTLSERADSLEEQQLEQLSRLIIVKSAIYTLGEVDPTAPRGSGPPKIMYCRALISR
jgi:hypothetical protein